MMTLQVQQKAGKIDDELSLLPDPPQENIHSIITGLLGEFSSEVKNFLDASQTGKFQIKWRGLRLQFKQVIREMRPVLSPVLEDSEIVKTDSVPVFTPASPNSGSDRTPRQRRPAQTAHSTPSRTSMSETIDLMDSDDEQPSVRKSSAQLFAKRLINANIKTESPFAKRMKIDQGSNTLDEDDMEGVFTSSKGLTCHRTYCTPLIDHVGTYKRFALHEIRKLIGDMCTTDLPGIVDPKVHHDLWKQSMNAWNQPLEQLVDTILRLLRERVDKVLDEVLKDYKSTALYLEAQQHMKRFLDDAELRLREATTERYELESLNPFTLDEAGLDMHNKSELEVLRKARHSARAFQYVVAQEVRDQKLSDQAMRSTKATKILETTLDPDPFEQEIAVFAKVRGYYLVSYIRWVDTVCQAIQGGLFVEMRKSIGQYLENALGIFGDGGECPFLVVLLVHDGFPAWTIGRSPD